MLSNVDKTPDLSKGMNPDKYLFNPFEIFFCGYSHSGKTTLIEKLTKKFSQTYRIGYVKHDAHHFNIDHEGKDSHRIYSAGALEVFINDQYHFAQINKGQADIIFQKRMMRWSDIVFVEGYKFDTFPKILVIDENLNIYKDYLSGKVTNVIALVGTLDPMTENKIPYFDRNDISGIEVFIMKYLDECIKKISLYGLILPEGKNSGMYTVQPRSTNINKSTIKNCFSLLSEFCEKVFVSVGNEQDHSNIDFPVINDTFLEMGSMGNIISALRAYNAAFLVLSGDIPYVSHETLKTLVSERNPFKFATSYLNPEISQPEALYAIYEPKIKGRLLDFISINSFCPVKVLLNSDVKLLTLP